MQLDFYGAFCHQKLKAEEAEARYIRLKEQYAMQQDIIEKLIRNGNKVCESYATVTYVLPKLEEV